jgi:hypothetical protein
MDNTHFQEYRASRIAYLVAQAVLRLDPSDQRLRSVKALQSTRCKKHLGVQSASV